MPHRTRALAQTAIVDDACWWTKLDPHTLLTVHADKLQKKQDQHNANSFYLQEGGMYCSGLFICVNWTSLSSTRAWRFLFSFWVWSKCELELNFQETISSHIWQRQEICNETRQKAFCVTPRGGESFFRDHEVSSQHTHQPHTLGLLNTLPFCERTKTTTKSCPFTCIVPPFLWNDQQHVVFFPQVLTDHPALDYWSPIEFHWSMGLCGWLSKSHWKVCENIQVAFLHSANNVWEDFGNQKVLRNHR